MWILDRLTYDKGKQALAVLIIINVAVFVLCFATSLMASVGWMPSGVAPWLALPSSLDALLSRPWTPLSYMVTHTDVFHILFNMLWLWWFGEVLASVLSPRRVVLIYILSGLSGALLFCLSQLVIFQPGQSSLIGASACVLGMMVSAALIQPDVEFRIFLIGNVKLKWLALVCVALAFLGIGGGNAGGESAHLGGVFFGLGYGLWYQYRLRHPAQSRSSEKADDTPRLRVSKRHLRQLSTPTLADEKRLDELLDKIRLSGFDSLTKQEQLELQYLSRRLNK